ncbi:MAG: ABC transporter ATP-binding protein [Planctomycetota bacterium]
MTDSPSLIVARDLRREYRPSRHTIVRALAGVSLDIEPGERVAVVGRSGSGKSTLMNLVGGLDRPDGGTLTVDGRELGRLSRRELARYRRETVGFVFQSFHLQPGATAIDNVALPLVFAGVDRRTRRRRAAALLERVGLAARGDHRPTELSGGEQQRVAVARAMVAGPRLLLADEPTGNLDSSTGEQVMEMLLQINRDDGTTLVLVTHDATLAAAVATRVLRMHDGQVVADERVGEPAVVAAASEGGAL